MILTAIAVDTFGDSYVVTIASDERGHVTVKQCRHELLTDDISDIWLVWSHDRADLVNEEECGIVEDALGWNTRIIRFMP